MLAASLNLFSIYLYADPIDEYLQCKMQNNNIPGLSLVVIQDGKIRKEQGYGFANVELRVPASAETIYESGSIGKQFTATLIMMLVEEGRVHLNDKISHYLPNTPPSWKDITIYNLLTHTSGIKNYGTDDFNYRLDYTNDQLLKKIESFPLNFAPGENWSYSNSGYVLLGIIIQNITGEFYGDLLQQKIFTPLGMNTASVISQKDIIPNRAAGYQFVDHKLQNQSYVSPSLNRTADGSLYFTVKDHAKWDAALYTPKLLSQTDLNLMWTKVKLGNGKSFPYGFGWVLGNINHHLYVAHGGEWQGFSDYIIRFPNDKLTVIILSNLADRIKEIKLMSLHVAGLYDSRLMFADNQQCQR